MALNTEVPNWLVDEIRWRRTIGDEGTKMVNNIVNLGGELLRQKGQREVLALNAAEQQRMHADMEQFPVWLQQHDNDPTGYVPKSNWGHQASQQAWQQKYQRGIVDLRREQADSLMDWRESQAELNKTRQENMTSTEKAMLESDKRFLKGLDLLPDQRAQILGPEGLKGHFNPDQWGRLKTALDDAGLKLPGTVEKAQSPLGKLQADRQSAIDSGAPDEVIKAYDQAIAKQAPTEAKEPMVKDVPGVGKIVWMPGSKGLHIAKGDKTIELTPSQALTLAKDATDPKDQEFFNEYAVSKGKSMTKGFTPADKPKEPEKPKTGFLGSSMDAIKRWFTGEEPPAATPTAPASAASHDEASDRPAQKTVRVKAPNGTTGVIPADQLDAAKQQGYTPLE